MPLGFKRETVDLRTFSVPGLLVPWLRCGRAIGSDSDRACRVVPFYLRSEGFPEEAQWHHRMPLDGHCRHIEQHRFAVYCGLTIPESQLNIDIGVTGDTRLCL